jgi:hypothetical protein
VNAGYTGSGYADFAGAGSSAQFAVNRTAAGTVTVGIRYANGSSTNRPYNVLVNGVNVGQLACPPTGSGSTWKTTSLTNVSLKAGGNTIRLVAVGAGADLDRLSVAPPQLQPTVVNPVHVEGESMALGGGTVANAGFTDGEFYVRYADFAGAGSYAQFAVDRAAAGNVSLSIQYANGSASNRPFNVLVNGANVGQFACPPTGSGSTWRTAWLSNVTLSAGTNVIRLVAVGAGADLDRLSVVSPQQPSTDAGYELLDGESLTLGGGTVLSSVNPGYQDSGYADFAGAGSYAEFTVRYSAVTDLSLSIQYANGSSTNRPFDVLVNGVKVGQFACPPTGSSSTWKTLGLSNPVTLSAGTSVVRLVAVGAGADVDELLIRTM